MFRKTQPRKKSQVVKRHPTADFALRYDMITQSEYDAIMVGQMDLTKDRMLLNLNHHDTPLKTGERTIIKLGRASRIMIDKLLEIKNPE